MSIVFRSTLRASSSRSASIMHRPPIPMTPFTRFNSSLPPAPPSSSSSSDGSGKSNYPGVEKLIFKPEDLSPTKRGISEESEQWWVNLSKSAQQGYPSTTWTGRSVLVPRNQEFMTAYKRLQGLLRNSNVKTELRLQEFHEKPSVRRRRLLSERHRRRFKEMVRNKVQQVMSMRTRG